MRRYWLLALLVMPLLAGALHGCQRSKPRATGADARDPEYAIYSLLIDNAQSIFQTGCLRPGYEIVVIEDRTNRSALDVLAGEGKSERDQYVRKNLPGLSPQTIDAFVARNRRRYPLRNLFTARVKCVLISEAEMRAIFDRGKWWPEFYRKYPKSQGILTLSRVGFNAAKDQALVCVGDQSEGRAGAGYGILLARRKGAWGIQSKVMLWIS